MTRRASRLKAENPEYRTPFLVVTHVTWGSFGTFTVKYMKENYPATFRMRVKDNPHYKWTELREKYAVTGDGKYLHEMLRYVTETNPPADLRKKGDNNIVLT